MPTIGHVKLDAKDYVLKDVNSYSMTPANQMAVKLGTGAGNYDDLENWAAWLMDDWTSGSGQKRGDDPGFKYSTADTRFGDQIILNSLTRGFAHTNGMGAYPTTAYLGEVAVSASGAVQKIRFKMPNPPSGSTNNVNSFYLLLQPTTANTTVVVQFGTRNDGTLVHTWSVSQSFTSVAKEVHPVFFHYPAQSNMTVAVGTTYWAMVEVTVGSATFPIWTVANSDLEEYNGSVWANSTTYNGGCPWLSMSSNPLLTATSSYETALYNDVLFLQKGTAGMYSHTSAGGWSALTTGLASSVAGKAVVWGNYVWYGVYEEGYCKSGLDGTSFTNTGVTGEVFYSYNGYLYRSDSNNLYYTNDGTTWEGPIEVGSSTYHIRDMAGLADSLYIATDEALWVLAPGDIPVGVMQWPAIITRLWDSATFNFNRYPPQTVRMMTWQGSLFITYDTSIYRYDQGGTLINISPALNGALDSDKQGTFCSLGASDFFLYVGLTTNAQASGGVPDDGLSFSSIWAYNGQGWHQVTEFPRGILPLSGNIRIDRVNKRIIIPTQNGPYITDLPESLVNPFEDSRSIPFFPYGWVEWEWFDGGLREVIKDCESVYIAGDNITADRPIKVYWMDDASTDWELLGTATSNVQELRWSDSSTRPATKRLRLAVLMSTEDVTETPRIDAIRVKYAPMVADRWRWQFPIIVADSQVMMDGSLNVQTAAQMVTSLNGLIQRVAPFTFVDVDNTSYTVKVTSATKQVLEMEQLPGGTRIFTYIYNLTVEQVDSNL